MKTTLVSKENNTAKLTMDFTAEEFDGAVNKVYRKNRSQFTINGFRKGKAPRSIIEKHYGEGIFFEDAINDLLSDGYPAALNELELSSDVIEQPMVDFSEIGKGKPFTVTCTVALFPIVEVKDYKGVAVEQTIADIKDEQVDSDIAALQKRNARMVVVDRPAENGDTVLLDYAGFVGEEQFEGGTAERQELKLGSNSFIPGFEDQLVGVSTGEQKDVNVTFPADYHAEDLAGKDAVFHCTVHEIKSEELPELDDEFAMDVSEFDTLEELKADTREKLQKRAEETNMNVAKDDLVNKIYEANKPETPRSLVETEIDNIANELNQQLSYSGLSLDQYCQFTGKTMAEFREDMRPDAERRAGTRVVLLSIADAENIEVTDEDVDKELEEMGKMYGMELDKMKEALEGSMDFVRKDLLVKKTIDMLYDSAEVTMVEPKEPAPVEEVEAPAETEEKEEDENSEE